MESYNLIRPSVLANLEMLPPASFDASAASYGGSTPDAQLLSNPSETRNTTQLLLLFGVTCAAAAVGSSMIFAAYKDAKE